MGPKDSLKCSGHHSVADPCFHLGAPVIPHVMLMGPTLTSPPVTSLTDPSSPHQAEVFPGIV